MEKVLVVEDDVNLRETIGEMIELLGFQPYLCENGVSALNTLEEIIPDLIISDLMMPYLDGGQLLCSLRKDPRFKGIPFLLLTAYPDYKNYMSWVKCEPDAHLSKPFDLQNLRSKIDFLITRNLV